MEIKPGEQINRSLNFAASKALTNVIASVQGRLVAFLLLLFCVFIKQSLKLFKLTNGSVGLGFLLTDSFVMILTILVAVYQIKKIRSVVIKIGSQVSITNEVISITPFTFGLFFWTKKPQYNLEFKINELKIRKTDNPLRFTWALDNRVFELRDKQKEAYIVFDYFDETLKDKLTEILVEVTPAELLLPGRLRHY